MSKISVVIYTNALQLLVIDLSKIPPHLNFRVKSACMTCFVLSDNICNLIISVGQVILAYLKYILRPINILHMRVYLKE